MQQEQLLTLDHQHLWHPCSQMKDYEKFKPLIIKKARGDYLELDSGQKIIDAISSWWCKSLGHNHPRLKQALLEQIDQFEHVILANTTHETIVNLSYQLAQLLPGLNKVFYAGDGSCAVEIAMKMSLHSRLLLNQPQRTRFIALENGYHGETVGALSVSDLGLYRAPYAAMLFNPYTITQIPYILSPSEPLWSDCSDVWPDIEASLAPHAETATALILEPLMQGAGGMRLYSAHFLQKLRAWTEAHGIHLIADEIMTGMGRTGKMLACEHAGIIPDFVCLSKGLTGGWLPFSAVLTRDEIYSAFYDDYEAGTAFLHSHTYSGNALGARVALETLAVIQQEHLCERAEHIGTIMRAHMESIAKSTGCLTGIRSLGAMVAADLVCDTPHRRLGYAVYQTAIQEGALLRPLGNTLYWLPPLTVGFDTLGSLRDITERAIEKTVKS